MQLHSDCDGVLAGIDCGATERLGNAAAAVRGATGVAAFWRELVRIPIFGSLPLMPDAMTLFGILV